MAIQPPPYQDAAGSIRWAEWYRQMNIEINAITAVSWTVIDFTGSNITDLATTNHNDLSNFDGGSAGQRYHLTSAQHVALIGAVLEARLDIDIVVNTDSPKTLDINDVVQLCDTSSGAITIQLPNGAAGFDGKIYYIKSIDATNDVTIDADSADTIDGATTLTLDTQYQTVIIQYSTTNDTWYILSTGPTTQSAAYTRNATIVEDRTLLASGSATATNNNNVLAALIADLTAAGLLV